MSRPYQNARPYTVDPVPKDPLELPRFLRSEFERLADIFGLLSVYTTAPKGALRLSTGVPAVVLNETWVDLNVFDETTVQRGGVVVSPHSIKVQQEATYEIIIGVNVSLIQTEQLDIMMTVNGVHAYSVPLSVQGAGVNDKPVALTWVSNKDLVVNDVVAWQVRNGAPGSVTVDFIRTNFSVRRD